jgi:hypothetical protein
MPVFDFGDWPEVHTVYPGFRILATMVYPMDHTERQELYSALVAKFLENPLNTPEDTDIWKRPPSISEVSGLLRARNQARASNDIFRQAQEKSKKGSVAGEALILIRQLAEHGHGGSIRTACEILAEAGKQRRLTMAGAPILVNATSLRDNAWSPYKPVAHLWTAHNILSLPTGKSFEEKSSPTRSWFEDRPAFEEFLALAEDFRDFGEKHVPHGRATASAERGPMPTLLPTETWRVPDNVSLPPIDLSVPPISVPWYQQALTKILERRGRRHPRR